MQPVFGWQLCSPEWTDALLYIVETQLALTTEQVTDFVVSGNKEPAVLLTETVSAVHQYSLTKDCTS